MKLAKTIVVLWCCLLWLAIRAHAQAVPYWSDNFDTNPFTHWVSSDDWHVTVPTEGPPVNSKGFRTYSGPYCANTEGYPYSSDGRIYCTYYLSGAGSNWLTVPDASLSPTLTFESWYVFANALGYVEVRTQTNGWQAITSDFGAPSGVSGGWVQESVDLSAFANQQIQIGFHFTSGGCCGNNEGWYVDDVAVVEEPSPPQVTSPTSQTIYAGQTFTVTLTATNDLLTGDTYRFSAPTSTNYSLTTAGVLTWTNTFLGTNSVLYWTNSFSPGTFTVNYVVTDNTTPALQSTNTFDVDIQEPPPPSLTIPSPQTVAYGQTLMVTNSVTNSVVPLATYRFSLVPVSTNVYNGITNVFNITNNASIVTNTGVLTWTDTNAPPGTNLISIVVTDNSHPPLTNIGVLAVIISPPPLVEVPTTQTIHAGQTVSVTVGATNSFLPASVFTYRVPNSPYYTIGTNSGVFAWTNNFITNGVLNWSNSVSPGTNVIYVTVADNNNPPMLSTSNFEVVVLPPIPPTLTVPANQTIYAGQTMVVTNFATNSVLTNCVFTFSATGLGMTSITTNGVLTWVTTTTQAPGTFVDTVVATDNSIPPLSATNTFSVTVENPPPPTLTVPPTQAIYAGQTLVVTNYATNAVFPNAIYIYSIAFGPANLNLNPTTGVLTWTPTAAQSSSINNIYIKATDNNSPPLSSIEGFIVLVSDPEQPSLSGGTLESGGGKGFEFTLNAQPGTDWRIDASTNLLNWQPIFTNFADPYGTVQFTDPAATNFSRRYYRAVAP